MSHQINQVSDSTPHELWQISTCVSFLKNWGLSKHLQVIYWCHWSAYQPGPELTIHLQDIYLWGISIHWGTFQLRPDSAPSTLRFSESSAA